MASGPQDIGEQNQRRNQTPDGLQRASAAMAGNSKGREVAACFRVSGIWQMAPA
jgi:hypothetical protein